MNMDTAETERKQIAAAIEGGAPCCDAGHHQYGRRIEADRSWTVYHVFTGIPARFDGDAMTGLSRSEATRGMLRLNLRNVERRRDLLSVNTAMG
jgi:hypothetical protein